MNTLLGSSVFASAALAETGSDIMPWLIGAGIIVVVGVAALIAGRMVRSRRMPPPAAPDAPGSLDGPDQISPDRPS